MIRYMTTTSYKMAHKIPYIRNQKQIGSECKSTIKPNSEMGAGDVAELVMCLLG